MRVHSTPLTNFFTSRVKSANKPMNRKGLGPVTRFPLTSPFPVDNVSTVNNISR